MIFLDVGSYSINLAHVVLVYYSPTREMVTLEFDVLDGDNPANLTLYDDESVAFKEFWECDLSRSLPSLTIYQVN